MKDGFKARNIWGTAIRALTDVEAGKLIKAVFEYTTTGQQPRLQGTEKGIFLMIASILRQDEEDERRLNEKKAQAGSAGGKQKAAKTAGASSATKNEANVADASSATKNIANVAGASDHITDSNIYNNNINNNNHNTDRENGLLFSRFWDTYPRHEAKEAAREAFEKLDPDEGLLETMITAIGKWKMTNQWKADGGRYIPNPANWLKQRRWEDEVPRPAPVKGTVTAQQYEQRDYSGVQEEMLDTQRREIEEKLRKKEEKKAGGEDT